MFFSASDTIPFIVKWYILPFFIGRICSNMRQMEVYMQEECQDINYTVVRPPHLTDESVTGKMTAKHCHVKGPIPCLR